jgi:hypothetical protein
MRIARLVIAAIVAVIVTGCGDKKETPREGTTDDDIVTPDGKTLNGKKTIAMIA